MRSIYFAHPKEREDGESISITRTLQKGEGTKRKLRVAMSRIGRSGIKIYNANERRVGNGINSLHTTSLGFFASLQMVPRQSILWGIFLLEALQSFGKLLALVASIAEPEHHFCRDPIVVWFMRPNCSFPRVGVSGVPDCMDFRSVFRIDKLENINYCRVSSSDSIFL